MTEQMILPLLILLKNIIFYPLAELNSWEIDKQKVVHIIGF